MGNAIYVVNFSKNYHRNIKNNYIFVFIAVPLKSKIVL